MVIATYRLRRDTNIFDTAPRVSRYHRTIITAVQFRRNKEIFTVSGNFGGVLSFSIAKTDWRFQSQKQIETYQPSYRIIRIIIDHIVPSLRTIRSHYSHRIALYHRSYYHRFVSSSIALSIVSYHHGIPPSSFASYHQHIASSSNASHHRPSW